MNAKIPILNGKVQIAAFLTILLAAAASWWMVSGNSPRATATYSRFLQSVEEGRVASVTIAEGPFQASRATYRLTDGRSESTVLPKDHQDAIRTLHQKQVNVEIEARSGSVLANATPFLALLGLWLFLMLWMPPGTRRVP